MNNKRALVVLFLVVLVSVAGPIVAALYIASRDALHFQTERAAIYAREALARSEEATDQISAGFDRLVESGLDFCSDDGIAIMRGIDLASSYIQAVGHVVEDRLVCSSLGALSDPLYLGPVDYVQPSGVGGRTDVAFHFAPGETFIVLERDGLAAIIHKALPLDSAIYRGNVSLALVTRPDADVVVLATRGPVERRWIEATSDQTIETFRDDSHLVVIVRSDRRPSIAIAAVPLSDLHERVREKALLLVPIGAVAALMLVLAVLHVVRRQTALPAIIRSALKSNEFFVVYQPVVDLRTRRWIGAEVLVRWERGDGEIIAPDVFIPAAEQAGMIGLLTRRVCTLVGREASGLFATHPDFHLAINLAAADLHDRATVTMLRDLADATGARPGNLIAEATERCLTDPSLARPVLGALREQGVRVAIDDFGTGYSSLAHLESLELDCLKIDKAFVDTLGTGAASSRVVLHIIEMAKSLGLEMIAEGVETEAQAQFLSERGVQYAQGYLFSKPLRFEELRRRLGGHSGG